MSVLLLVGASLLLVLLATLKSLAVTELTGWLPLLCRAIAELAVRRLPVAFRERYLEEWLADLEQLRDRPLSALRLSLLLAIRSGSMRAQLPSDGRFDGARSRWQATRSVFLPKLTFTAPLVEIPLRTGALVDWQEVVGAMREGSHDPVDERLERAHVRFTALLTPAAQPPSMHALQTLRERAQADAALARAAVAGRPRITTPIELDPYWYRPPMSNTISPRFGPEGRADPEWRIAPLTGRERAMADPYIDAEHASGLSEALCGHWPDATRNALVQAVEDFDVRCRRERRGACSDDHAIRLSVFLESWERRDEDRRVRCLPGVGV